MQTRLNRFAVALFAVVVLVGACGGGTEADTERAGDGALETTAAPATTAATTAAPTTTTTMAPTTTTRPTTTTTMAPTTTEAPNPYIEVIAGSWIVVRQGVEYRLTMFSHGPLAVDSVAFGGPVEGRWTDVTEDQLVLRVSTLSWPCETDEAVYAWTVDDSGITLASVDDTCEMRSNFFGRTWGRP